MAAALKLSGAACAFALLFLLLLMELKDENERMRSLEEATKQTSAALDQATTRSATALTETMNALQEELLVEMNAPNSTSGVTMRCAGKRIAVYGSSHARSLSFSLSQILVGTGMAYPPGEMGIGMFTPKSVFSSVKNRSISNVCVSYTALANGQPIDSCDLPEYKALLLARKVCRYTYDAGVDVENCGYPYMKRWVLGDGQYHGSPSAPINSPDVPVPEVRGGRSDNSLTHLMYLFKTWAYTPNVDREATRHVLAFRPDAAILDFSMWGCRTPNDGHFFLKAGIMGWPEDEARPNCTADVWNAVHHWDKALTDKTHLVVHFVNSLIQRQEELAANLNVVRHLQQLGKRKHVLIDKKDLIGRLTSNQVRSLEHGYYGIATYIWARAALGIICDAGGATVE